MPGSRNPDGSDLLFDTGGLAGAAVDLHQLHLDLLVEAHICCGVANFELLRGGAPSCAIFCGSLPW